MYLAFPTGIYLFKINNKKRKALSEICPVLTRKAPDQMWETKLWQMCHFLLFWPLSILWIYHFQCSSTSFLSLYLSIATMILHIFWISTRFPAFSRWFEVPAFPSHSSHSHPYSPHFPHFVPQFPILAFTDSLLSLQSLRICFKKIIALVKKLTFSFVSTA